MVRFTVSSLRCTTLPVRQTTDSSRTDAAASNIGEEESTTHWVMP